MSNISKELQETINGYKNEAVVCVNRFEHLINELCGQIIQKDYMLSDLSVLKIIHEGKIKELENNIFNAEANNEQLQNFLKLEHDLNEELNDRIEELKSDFIILEHENSELAQERDEWGNKNILLSKKVEDLNNIIQLGELENTDLSKMCLDQKQKIINLQKELENLRNRIDESGVCESMDLTKEYLLKYGEHPSDYKQPEVVWGEPLRDTRCTCGGNPQTGHKFNCHWYKE